ncbi:dihydroxyacetone kinase phosphoryl donor subunit DhaM [Spiroplasma chrysopicola]|uniref:phosphoenolpyruvate--glycerone phosphotransferase n=1 Tax=Spiroplasma chrysopicola DF-1 TaxID=1276227 RepID=R4U4C8_9MOLU|nr:dihydroxyacetone kinase phosphoryl donor subunit DhaM [Spiroplasma chrysopicola]AGM25423.1 dihydroxyacetone kinase phosphotransfer subunit [Spiroplasma chrysopicola DF-1]
MVAVLVVSHSYPLAKAVVDFVSEMKINNFPFQFIGGIDEGQAYGTDPILIQNKLTELLVDNDVLVLCDLGSSIMNTEMAINFLSPVLQKRVAIADSPFFEGTLVAITSNHLDIDLATLKHEVETMSRMAKM